MSEDLGDYDNWKTSDPSDVETRTCRNCDGLGRFDDELPNGDAATCEHCDGSGECVVTCSECNDADEADEGDRRYDQMVDEELEKGKS